MAEESKVLGAKGDALIFHCHKIEIHSNQDLEITSNANNMNKQYVSSLLRRKQKHLPSLLHLHTQRALVEEGPLTWASI